MNLFFCRIFAGVLAISMVSANQVAVAQTVLAIEQTELPLWDGDMPGVATAEQESVKPSKGDNVLRITNVSKPTLKLFLVDAESPSPLVIVCPGGAYQILSYDKEGIDVAQWLNSIGVSAAVLKYRVPDNRDGALADARQAVRLVRQKAKDWNVAPNRIGMLGFSAGGHLTAACSNSPDRPDFSILVYPAYLDKNGTTELVDEISVDKTSPPAFVVQTLDDKKYYRSTLAYAWALEQRSVPVEVHLFAKGGHGYGLRSTGHPVAQWPKLCESWLNDSGYIKRDQAAKR